MKSDCIYVVKFWQTSEQVYFFGREGWGPEKLECNKWSDPYLLLFFPSSNGGNRYVKMQQPCSRYRHVTFHACIASKEICNDVRNDWSS